MTILLTLWLPIVLSAVFVFVASCIIHMFLPWHTNDYVGVEQQDKVQELLRPFAIPPGDYMLPKCSTMAEMRTPEFKEKVAKGPVIIMTVLPGGGMAIGKNMLYWFLYLLVVAYGTAYVVGHSVQASSTCMAICKVAAMASFMGYCLSVWQMTIWYSRSVVTSLKTTADSLVYAAITASVFAWLVHR
jgi:hypothetical protein